MRFMAALRNGHLREWFEMTVAWLLPRKIAYWAFIRVTTEGCAGNPSEQGVAEIQKRWAAQ